MAGGGMSRPVFVSEYGVLSPGGDSPLALLSATLSGVSAVNVIKDLAVAVGSDYRAHFPRLACLPGALEWEDRVELALRHLLDQSHPVLLITPDQGAPQFSWMRDVLSLADPEGRLEWVTVDALASVLSRQVIRLRAGEISALSVFGLDSLVHPVNVMQLAASAQLQTDKLPDGRAVGEGFAWFTLSCQPAPVEWLADAAGVEPNAGEMMPASLLGLADTISALKEDGELPRPRLIIHARAQAPQDDLEWHHASQRLWPARLAPRENLAMRKGEQQAPQPAPPPWQQHLKPAKVTGELGAAAFPMAIALACERLCWSLAPAPQALVVDAGAQQARCAVWLKNTESQGCDSNE